MRNKTLSIAILTVIMAFITVSACSARCVFASDILSSITAGAGRETAAAAAEDSSLLSSAGAERVIEDTDTAAATDTSSAASETETASDSASQTDPLAGLCVANVENSMNVRKEPSEDSALAGYLYKDCVGTVIGQKDGWTHIKSGDLDGWAKDKYLLFGSDAEERISESNAKIATVTTDTLRVRDAADPSADVTALLAKGEELTVLDTEGEWTKIRFDDGTEGNDSGYVSSEYVSMGYDLSNGETCDAVEARLEEEKAEKAAEAEKEAKAEKAAKEKAAKSSSRSTASSKSTAAAATANTGAAAASADEQTLLAALIQCECGYEPYEGQLAVGAVVVNRAKGGYGSIKGAIYAPGQFGPASSGKLALTLATGAIGANARKAAAEALGGTTNVGTATHFRNVRSGYSGIVIGNHVFW